VIGTAPTKVPAPASAPSMSDSSVYTSSTTAPSLLSQGCNVRKEKGADRSRRPLLDNQGTLIKIHVGDGPLPSPVPPWNRRSPVLRGRGFSTAAQSTPLRPHFVQTKFQIRLPPPPGTPDPIAGLSRGR
jgi:hypothetical protein